MGHGVAQLGQLLRHGALRQMVEARRVGAAGIAQRQAQQAAAKLRLQGQRLALGLARAHHGAALQRQPGDLLLETGKTRRGIGDEPGPSLAARGAQ